MYTRGSYRHLKIAALLLFSVLTLSTIGYMLIEHFPFDDALYTTVMMISTAGHVVHPLSTAGRMFTIGVIAFGVGSLLYTLGVGMEFMIEGHFNQAIRRRFMDNKIKALRSHYIVCGFGRVGSQIAEDFAALHKAFVVIDENEHIVQNCIEQGYLAVQGDGTSDDVLREAGIQHARGLLVATDNDAHNIFITLSARHLNGELLIVSRANRFETEAKLKLAGADRVLSPYAIGGHRMANLALQPGVVEFFDTITKAGSVELAVQEIGLMTTSPLIGKTMADAQNIVSDGTMMVALKKRDAGLIVGSRSDISIEAGDSVIVVGAPEQLSTFKREYGTQPDKRRM